MALELKRKYYPFARNLSVTEAFAVELESSSTGAVESAQETADKTTKSLGSLVEVLHAKGILSNSDVIDLLGSDWEEVK